MKKALLAMMMLVSSVASATSNYVLYTGSNYKIISEYPYVDGGSLKYNNVQIEVQGRVQRLAGSRIVGDIFVDICKQTDFKHVYEVAELAGFFEKSVKVTQEGLVRDRHEVLVANLICMKEAY